MTISGGNFEAGTIVKTGGTSSQFLKADGSVDSNTYLTTASAGTTYVPYTGAGANVDLGIYNLTANAVNVNGSGSNAGVINLESNTIFSLVNGYGTIGSGTTNQFNLYQTTGAGVFRGAILSLNSITASATRTFTLPDADGTLALTTDLSGYLPLTGGTLSNNLFITGGGLQVSGSASANRQVVELYTSSTVSRLAASYVGSSSYGDLELLTGGLARLTITAAGASTFSGALNGTSATFSTEVTSSGGQGRFGGWATGAGYQGNALEVGVSGGNAFMIGYNRTSGSYIPLSIGGTTNQTTTIGGSSIVFQNNGVTALTIASTGAATFSSSVAINGSTSVDSLTVSRNVADNGGGVTLYNADTGGYGSALTFRVNYAGVYNVSRIHGDWGIGNSGILHFFTANTSQSLVERMTIDGSGNVGIGTDSPAWMLEVKKDTTSGSFGQYPAISVNNPNASGFSAYYFFSGATNKAGFEYSNSSNNLLIYGNGAERMRITSDGFLKAKGTESTYYGATLSYHELRTGTGAEWTTIFTNTSANPYGIRVLFPSSAPNNSDNWFIYCDDLNAARFRVASNGNVTNQNGSYGSISDAKLKENITDASPKLDDLMKVKVRNYNLIGDDRKQIGVIAQELEEVFPAMIEESQDFEEVEVPQLDEEGNEVRNEEGEVVTEKQMVSKGTTTKSVKYSIFVPMLIKAMQEQQEQIQELKTEIDSLKNQIK